MPDYNNSVTGWNPNPTLYLSYQKFSGVIPEEERFFAFAYPVETGSVSVHEKPQWINVVVDEYVYSDGNIDFVNYLFVVNQTQANILPPGIYQGEVRLQFTRAVLLNGTYLSVPIQVTLEVTEAIPLSITPQNYNFNYTIGDLATANEYLQITTSNNWSIASNQSWLSFSQTNGSGTQTISLSVDPSGMPAGTYVANFIVDDGNSTKTGIVTLVVVGNGVEENYISITPEQLFFSEALEALPQSQATITVDASEVISVISSVSWLVVSENNLPTGASTFQVSTQNTQPLEIGTYPGEITLLGENVNASIEVLLVIVEEASSGLENFGFYFAHARNRLNLTNGAPNSEVFLDFVTQATLGQKQYKKKIPYYQNSISAVIGLETESLLKPQALPSIHTHFFKPIIPIEMALKVSNKIIGSQSANLLQEYFGMKWINGKNPNVALEDYFSSNDIESIMQNSNHLYRLTYLPKKQYLPKDGVVAFSLYAKNPLQNAVVLINGVNYIINVNIQESTNIYSCFIKLSDYDLSIGDKITIYLGLITSEIIIRDSQLPTHQLIWLNQWDCPEVFNCTGPIELILDDGNEESTYQVDGKEYSKTIEVKEPKSFKINTGEIYTAAEINHLASIIRSKKIWIQIGNDRHEVIKAFRDISTFESRRFVNEYDLKFESATK